MTMEENKPQVNSSAPESISFKDKIKNEFEYLKRLRRVSFLLVLSLILQLLGFLTMKVFWGETWFGWGVLMYWLGGVIFVFQTMEYAKAKGVSQWFGLLGYLGFVIIFSQSRKEMQEQYKPISKPFTIIDALLILILAFSLFSYSQITIHGQLYGKYLFNKLFPYQYPISMLGAIIIPIWALIANKKRVIPVASLLVLLAFLSYLYFFVDQNRVMDEYKAMRNLFYLYLIMYPVFHLLIHSLSRLKDKTREIITPQGLFTWEQVLILTTLLYGVYDLLK